MCGQYQWRIYQDVPGTHGARTPPPPPMAQNLLNFMQFFGKFGNFLCWRPLDGWRPLLRGILDPPVGTHSTGIHTCLSFISEHVLFVLPGNRCVV